MLLADRIALAGPLLEPIPNPPLDTQIVAPEKKIVLATIEGWVQWSNVEEEVFTEYEARGTVPEDLGQKKKYDAWHAHMMRQRDAKGKGKCKRDGFCPNCGFRLNSIGSEGSGREGNDGMRTTNVSTQGGSENMEGEGETIRGEVSNSLKKAPNPLSTGGDEAEKSKLDDEEDDLEDGGDEKDDSANEADVSGS